MLQSSDEFIHKEDAEIAEEVLKSFKDRGIEILYNADLTKVEEKDDGLKLTYDSPDGENTITGDNLLVATGRRPLVKDLNLEAVGVELTDRDAVNVDEHLVSSKEHILALGDVRGELKFTYISLDDYRIAYDQVRGVRRGPLKIEEKFPTPSLSTLR